MATILTHTDRLNKLRTELELKIRRRVGSQTRFSKHVDCKAFLIKRCRFNLCDGRWLEEITKTNLIDNQGYIYDFNVLTIEQLCEIGDELFYCNLSRK